VSAGRPRRVLHALDHVLRIKFRYVESKVAEAFLERLMDPTHSEGASSR